MGKRKDECLFCNSRSCYFQIYRFEEPVYNEIACSKHITDLEKHSEKVLGTNNGIKRTHLTSTGKLKRNNNPLGNRDKGDRKI
jgi:hypothetical protein